MNQMSSDRDNCGLSSLLPMSCRGRAEAFARRLHTRLRSLGSQDGNTNETSWLTTHENSIALSQPRHASTDSEVFFDFGAIESPPSPNELETAEIDGYINEDNLRLLHGADCHCPKKLEAKNQFFNHVKAATSNDSDSSDGPFYDTENDILDTETAKQNNGVDTNELLEDEGETNEESADLNTQDDLFITSSECTLPQTSLSEDLSTLSLSNKDDDGDCSSLLDFSNSLNEPNKNDEEINEVDEIDETYTSSLNIDHNLTVVCPNTNEIELVLSTSDDCIKLDCDTTSNAHNSTTIEEEDDDETEERIPRVRRCSSLKTGKTPPGTPGRKKIVRFADVLGLDLADVRTFLDEIPKVPHSAYDDLKNVDLNDTNATTDSTSVQSSKFHGIKVEKVLVPLFQQPGGQSNFLDRVRESQVCLENALVEDPLALSITGTVRVRNLDFNKTVHIRYSLDSWQNFADVPATYLPNSCDGFSDKFSFLMYAHTLLVGQRLEFAVRFQCKGCQYWDNNNGANYCFQCLPATTTTSYEPITGEDGWGASFY